MRRIVLQVMTTLDGRLDDPMAWVRSVGEDQYRDIDRLYASYDTVLVGRTTYEEMAAYWPRALAEGEGTETNVAMARRMDSYRKLVFSRSGTHGLTGWNNTELVTVDSDAALADYLAALKAAPGRDIQLAGGASFAQAVLALGLVDELQLFIYPVVSSGTRWFSRLSGGLDLDLLDTRAYENGVVRLHYTTRRSDWKARPDSFTALLA